MSFEQTFAIECDDHTFEFTISRETATLLQGRGYEKDINGVTCPTCGKMRSISFKEIVKQRKQAEKEERQAAKDDAETELLAAAGGDKKRVDKDELEALTEKKVHERVKARAPLAIGKAHAKEKDLKAPTWSDASRGHMDHGGGPPVAPDTDGVIDSTG